MASNELVPLNDALGVNGDRRMALQRLNEAAVAATTPEEARQVMLTGQALASVLKQAKAPWEEAFLAGKASTLAARRLGQLLKQLEGKAKATAIGTGPTVSERGKVRVELGLSYTTTFNLMRLASVDDPDFQRYIQQREQIPSMSGALVAAGRMTRSSGTEGTWQAKKRKRANVQTPAEPSLDEAYSLIVRALGHLNGLQVRGRAPKSGVSKSRAVAFAMDALYVAEDHLKPFRGGYVE